MSDSLRAPRPTPHLVPSRSRSVAIIVAAAPTVPPILACGDPVADAGRGSEELLLSVHTAGPPLLSIGALDGDEEYEFGSISGLAELDDGRLAVSDAGAGHVSLFSADGVFQQRVGSPGEGPGEFAQPSRVFPHGSDSLAVFDAWRRHISYFDAGGSWARDVDVAEVTGESVYAMDVFPASRYVVEGPRTPEARLRVGTVVAGLPTPSGRSLVRWLKVSENGELWIRESAAEASGESEWLVLGPEGLPRRMVRLPHRFEPHLIRSDEVLGVRTDDLDVAYVERRGLQRSEAEAPVPEWFALGSAVTPEPDFDVDEMRSAAINSMKRLASHQEMHYARNFTYTTDLGELEIEDLPEGMTFEVLAASPQGWSMVVAHPGLPTICTLAYGKETPPGWLSGSIDCGTVNGVGGDPPPWARPDAESKGEAPKGED